MSRYSLQLYSPDLRFVAEYTNLLSISVAQTEMQGGELSVTLPPNTVTPDLWQDLGILLLFRESRLGEKKLVGNTGFLLEDIDQRIERGGVSSPIIAAKDALVLLEHRIIDYTAGSAQAAKTSTPADDLIKEFVRENTGPGTETTNADRRYPAELWSVAPDLSLGPNLSKSAAWKPLLTTIQEVSQACINAGTYLTFAVQLSGGLFEFRTFINQLGEDRTIDSSDPVLLSALNSTMANVRFTRSIRNEATHIISGGQGEGTARTIERESNDTRAAISPFGRRERFVDARNTEDSTAVADEAKAALYTNRLMQSFGADYVDIPTVDWGDRVDFGDLVSVQFNNAVFDARIKSYRISMQNNQETIQARIEVVF